MAQNGEKWYSIGEMSELMGISPQTLRHYCNIGLIAPEFIDPDSGYRYFSFRQFHYIDRARYLLACGFHLKEIKEILDSNDVELLKGRLHHRQLETEAEIQRAEETLETLRWYEEYFAYGEQSRENSTSCYIRHFETRYLLAIHCEEDYVHQNFYPLFHQLRSRPEFRNLRYKRQFTAILDYHALLHRIMKRYRVGMFTLEDPGFSSPNLVKMPEGNYWCFLAPIVGGNWNPYILKKLIQEHGEPKLLLASEYEDNLQNYQDCLHEVQILF